MKKKTYGIIIGLSLVIILSAIDASARGASTARNESFRNSSSGFQGGARLAVRGGSARAAFHTGSAKVSVWGGASARGGNHGYASGGFREGGNHYYSGYHHGYHHGYYGRGSYWPYWSVGSFVTYLPDDYTTVFVDGSPYYYCDGSYFMPYSSGYVVVPTPAPVASQDEEATVQASSDEQPIAAQPKSAKNDTATITINIPNSKGGFSPVVLVKHKNGYIGPQGEFYTGHPTVAALKALYGD